MPCKNRLGKCLLQYFSLAKKDFMRATAIIRYRLHRAPNAPWRFTQNLLE